METGDPLVNDGTLGAGLGGMWGCSGYANSAPISHVDSAGPDVTINGQALIGLEDDNTGAEFTGMSEPAADLLNLNPAGAGSGPSELDQENMTYSFFFKMPEQPCTWARLVTSHPSNANRLDICFMEEMFCIITSGGEGMYNTAENRQQAEAGAEPYVFTDEQWHHMVVVRNGDDATNIKIFVDGQDLSSTMYIRNGGWGSGYALRVGSQGTGSNYSIGTLDEIAMWGRALSDEEALGLYEAATVPEPATTVLLITMFAAGAVCSRRKSC
jgi:hypothetical protein